MLKKGTENSSGGIVLLTSTATALVGPMAFFGFMLANLTYLIVRRLSAQVTLYRSHSDWIYQFDLGASPD